MATRQTLYIEDEISDVVASIRDTGSITSFTDNADDTYTLLVTDLEDLADNDYITITGTVNFNGSNYLISNLNSIALTFDISLTSGYATETGTYTANKPYYKYGHPIEIKNLLNEQAKTTTYKYQRYPFIALFEDITQSRDQQFDTYTEVNLFITIVMETKRGYTTEQRKELIFKPTLIPLYNDFMNALKNGQDIASKFMFEPGNLVSHNYTNRYFWGSVSPEQNILDAYADAIELTDLKLKFVNRFSECSIY